MIDELWENTPPHYRTFAAEFDAGLHMVPLTAQHMAEQEWAMLDIYNEPHGVYRIGRN